MVVGRGQVAAAEEWRATGGHNLQISRTALRAALLAAAEAEPLAELVWGVAAEGVEELPAGNGVRVRFGSGRAPFVAACTVGCDGIFSRLRQQYVGDRLRFLGLVVILGIFDAQGLGAGRSCPDSRYPTGR